MRALQLALALLLVACLDYEGVMLGLWPYAFASKLVFTGSICISAVALARAFAATP